MSSYRKSILQGWKKQAANVEFDPRQDRTAEMMQGIRPYTYGEKPKMTFAGSLGRSALGLAEQAATYTGLPQFFGISPGPSVGAQRLGGAALAGLSKLQGKPVAQADYNDMLGISPELDKVTERGFARAAQNRGAFGNYLTQQGWMPWLKSPLATSEKWLRKNVVSNPNQKWYGI